MLRHTPPALIETLPNGVRVVVLPDLGGLLVGRSAVG